MRPSLGAIDIQMGTFNGCHAALGIGIERMHPILGMETALRHTHAQAGVVREAFVAAALVLDNRSYKYV